MRPCKKTVEAVDSKTRWTAEISYLREDDNTWQAIVALHEVPQVRLTLAANVLRGNFSHVAPLQPERRALVVDNAASYGG